MSRFISSSSVSIVISKMRGWV